MDLAEVMVFPELRFW